MERLIEMRIFCPLGLVRGLGMGRSDGVRAYDLLCVFSILLLSLFFGLFPSLFFALLGKGVEGGRGGGDRRGIWSNNLVETCKIPFRLYIYIYLYYFHSYRASWLANESKRR